MSIPLYRAGTRVNRTGRTILVLEYDVTDLGEDIQVVLDENERLKSEVKRLSGVNLAQSNELKSVKGGALTPDSDDAEQLKRLRKAAEAAKKQPAPAIVEVTHVADEPAAAANIFKVNQ